MSDTYRRYGAIKRAIMQFYQPQPSGHRERHLNTLVALICGLAGGQRAHLSTIADHAPSGTAKQESLIDRFRRWLKHDAQTLAGWFLPVAQALLENLATQPIQLVMDGSVVGRGCIALMLSVVYHGRALPLAWVVVRGKKGHFPQAVHCELLAQVQAIMPHDATVIFATRAMASLTGRSCKRRCGSTTGSMCVALPPTSASRPAACGSRRPISDRRAVSCWP